MIAPDFDSGGSRYGLPSEKSLKYLENHAKSTSKKPFFLFHSMQAVHLPSFAGDAFKGKTKAGRTVISSLKWIMWWANS